MPKRTAATRAADRDRQRARRARLATDAAITSLTVPIPAYARTALTIAARLLCKIPEAEQLGVMVGYRTRQGRTIMFKL